ncbi:iron-sulfur cluster assembly scaffold protein [Acanthopleuribacter pedis]|uniref:Iron-sulfur cluster assembly scaffold protein n=1 Tax=Acanthopleuribacter pedis TaxID=442870 RepID=A0A8J7QH79_9BACT|nr:iron-sulfur cluster assembly scaffold protein [Acanthopleuribacter pedis]MBO1320120.1 iron-sulfur cluster assembly scaffold protein [Acanthopleuribacter pedis]
MNGIAPGVKALYREAIKDYAARLADWPPPEVVTHRAEGFNPHCGDALETALHCREGRIAALGFDSESCVVCHASAALMAQVLQGIAVETVPKALESFENALRGHIEWPEVFDEASCLEPVRDFPSRIQCALLPWHTLAMCFHPQPTTACTEEEIPE